MHKVMPLINQGKEESNAKVTYMPQWLNASHVDQGKGESNA